LIGEDADFILMSGYQEDTGAWELTAQREWVVEYITKVDGEKEHHLTILRASDAQEVQRSLFMEIRRSYLTTEQIEVTILRLEPVSTNTDNLMFSETFAP